MLDLIRSRIYLGDECLSACPPCDFGLMMRLWNRLSCTSAAEPERLIARGAITSSILLVKIIVQLCVFLCASVCVCVCPQSISDGTRYRFLPLKCSNKTNTANWLLLSCMLMCLFIEVVPVQYTYLCMYKQRKRECKNMNRSVYRMQNLSQIMNPETSLQFCGLLIKCLNYNSDKQEDPHYIHSSPEWNICILTPLGFYELWRCWSRELTCVIFGDLIITGRLDRSHLASACDHVWLRTQRRKELNVWRMPNLQEGPSDNEFVVDSVTQSF